MQAIAPPCTQVPIPGISPVAGAINPKTGTCFYGGALAAPSTAYLYNWNILPIGQVLWLKELQSYVDFPPMQDPASYNVTQVLEEVKREGHRNPSE